MQITTDHKTTKTISITVVLSEEEAIAIRDDLDNNAIESGLSEHVYNFADAVSIALKEELDLAIS